MEKVSVIVPVYKVEPYLTCCVDSILAQTYSDLDVILVDDGSPDRCPEICDEYARRDSRIRVIHQKNGGVSSARNAALETMTGTYVTFCDSDDSYEPEWIASLVRAMENQRADVVVGMLHMVFQDSWRGYVREHETGVYETRTPEAKVNYCIQKVFGRKHGWEVWRRLFRSEIIRKRQIRFCETCENFAEDLGFVLEYSLYADRIVSIAEAGYRYLVRGGSMMNSSVEKVKLNAVNEVFLHAAPHIQTVIGSELSQRMLPIFHFLIMYNQYEKMIELKKYRLMKTPAGQIQQYSLWKQYTQQLSNCKGDLTNYFERNNMLRAVLLSHHCLHGQWWLFRMEWKLINWFDRIRGHIVVFG